MRSMNDIYFDNSATTRVTDRAAAKAAWAMSQVWGNPSSVHGKGVEAERLISEARTQLLRTLGIRHAGIGQLFFTGSGTEADNMAVSGVLYSKARRGTPRIITTDSEHPAVANPIREAEAKGFEVVRLSTVGGVIDPAELEAALEKLYLGEVKPLIKKCVSALIYTQLSDIEDETNGFLTYDRRVLKTDAKRISDIMKSLKE